MAETTAQKRKRKLHEAVVASRSRRQLSPQDEAAIDKMVAPKEEASTNVDEQMRTQHYTANRPSPSVRREQPTPRPTRIVRQQSVQGSNKVYTKHVLFALVSAFLIQLVANNKSLPIKGG